MTSVPTERCAFCGARLRVVHVHGHGQCAACGTNLEPCCSGAGSGEAGESLAHRLQAVAPDLFAHVFATLGGPQATVTRQALVFALAQRLGGDLDDADVVLEAGARVGKVQKRADGTFRLLP